MCFSVLLLYCRIVQIILRGLMTLEQAKCLGTTQKKVLWGCWIPSRQKTSMEIYSAECWRAFRFFLSIFQPAARTVWAHSRPTPPDNRFLPGALPGCTSS